MSDIVEDHLDRLRTAVLKRYGMANLAAWVQKHTFIGGRPYSFKDHEYQERILSDTSQEVYCRKCSQVGVSEATARMALAMVNVVSPLTAIYCLPTATFAATFMKTRISPVIEGSPTLKGAVHRTNDNTELKQFGNSFLYLRGAASSNAPISIPADVVISDETDFSDQEVLSQYTSRLTHSKWRIIRKFSTPTIPGFGVDKSFQESRRFFNMCKCNHCSQWFLPDYYKHVQIPGYTKDLREINKQTLSIIRWQEAKVICPNCGNEPSLQIEHREYVCENPDQNYVGAGYQVSPFDAPNVVTPSYLVKASTDYQRLQDFVNFSLGNPMEDSEATLTREDFEGVFVRSDAGRNGVMVLGIDVGNIYHFTLACINAHDEMFVVKYEQVPMGKAKERYREIVRDYRVVCSVIDSQPHAETVMALQADDPNLFASVYVRNKSLLTHNVVEKEKDADEGQEFVRQVNVNRSRAFDAYMLAIRENKVHYADCAEKETIIQHHTSMKRIKLYDHESAEMAYSWQKTDGIDHAHHSALYCWIAGRIKGVGKPLIALPTTRIWTFKQKR